MSRKHKSRWNIVLTAWPWQGAVFLAASFGFTLWWLRAAYGDGTSDPANWLEPLVAMLGGLGAFVLAAILIFRKVDSARSDADAYGLARGLATGYYFNFIRPLILAIRDPKHSIHELISKIDELETVAVVTGIPAELEDFDVERHDTIYHSLTTDTETSLELHELKVNIEGRPRPVFARLLVNRQNRTAVIVDIPTTLSVIKDFAEHVATRGEDASDDEFIAKARTRTVAESETEEFTERLKRVLEEFQSVVGKIGAADNDEAPIASLVHIVPVTRMKRRVSELLDA